MRRFQFRLATVLRVRRVEEERVRGALALANAARRRAETELSHAEERLAATPEPAGVVSLAAYRAWRATGELRAEGWHVASERVSRAAEVAEERRQAWAKAAVRVAALERLEERRRDAWRQELSRAEVREVDDLVTSRFQPEELEPAPSAQCNEDQGGTA
jgi:flagellar export protein FliJ